MGVKVSRRVAALSATAVALAGPLASAENAPSPRVAITEMYSTHLFVAVDVAPSGHARFESVRPSVTKERKVEAEVRQHLDRLIEEVAFHDLDEAYGVCYLHDVMRRIVVESGGREKKVELCSVSRQDVPEGKRAGALRAWRVWNAVRLLFPDDYPEAARHEAASLLNGQPE